MLNGTGYITKDNKIAMLERLIEAYRQRRKHITQYGLNRQRNRDPPDAQAGDQCGNIDAHVRQNGQEHHDPDHDPQQNSEDHRRHRIPHVQRVAQQAFQPEPDAAVDPQRELNDQRQEPAVCDGHAPGFGQVHKLQGNQQ